MATDRSHVGESAPRSDGFCFPCDEEAQSFSESEKRDKGRQWFKEVSAVLWRMTARWA